MTEFMMAKETMQSPLFIASGSRHPFHHRALVAPLDIQPSRTIAELFEKAGSSLARLGSYNEHWKWIGAARA